MNSALLNAHLKYGRPCGPDANFDQISEWAGNLLLDLAWLSNVNTPVNKEAILRAILASRNITLNHTSEWITDSVPPQETSLYGYNIGTYDHKDITWIAPCGDPMYVFAWRYKSPKFHGDKETPPQWNKLPTKA